MSPRPATSGRLADPPRGLFAIAHARRACSPSGSAYGHRGKRIVARVRSELFLGVSTRQECRDRRRLCSTFSEKEPEYRLSGSVLWAYGPGGFRSAAERRKIFGSNRPKIMSGRCAYYLERDLIRKVGAHFGIMREGTVSGEMPRAALSGFDGFGDFSGGSEPGPLYRRLDAFPAWAVQDLPRGYAAGARTFEKHSGSEDLGCDLPRSGAMP